MLTFIAACFHKVLWGEIIESGESKTKSTSKFIYRDELSQKKAASNQKSCPGPGNSFSSTKPLVIVKDPKMSRVRVKVKMTKEEAARLLSRCKDGGVIEFKDVARELVNIPMNRVTVISPFPATNSLLDSIPEEC